MADDPYNTDLDKLQADMVAAGLPVLELAFVPAGIPMPPECILATNTMSGQIIHIQMDNPIQLQIDQAIEMAEDATIVIYQPRLIYDIYRDLAALTNPQLLEIWNVLEAGDPPLWASSPGGNEAAMVVMHWTVMSLAGATQTEKNDARKRLISMYCQEHPDFLVHPSFEPVINISGKEPV